MLNLSRSLLVHGLAATALAASAAMPAWAQSTPAAAIEPLITRIKIATVGAKDVEATAKLYAEWLDYTVIERSTVSQAMADSWGTPKTAGKPFVLMHGKGSPDVYFRVVQADAPGGYKAMTTFGWNSIEVLVEDPDKVYEKLKNSPFRHVGGPANLMGGTSSIRAVQFVGPSEETFYFTADTAPADKAVLPRAKSFIDRTFIMVLAGPDADALSKFYTETFLMGGYPPRPVPIDIIAKAQGLPLDHQFPLGLARAAEPGNNIEIDGYPASAKARPRADGQLPPGVAMSSFNVNSLDGLKVSFIKPPAKLYGEKRAATFIGPAGELTELIEEPRP
ncbi:MAG: hypothetical protein SFV21_17010 [Rhodospirillaceae bacterium]|nr:hypothetical protein [Rhodospirillaceae bacterium]